MKRIVAIDPGASGGIAYTTDESVEAIRMPREHSEIVATLRELKTSGAVCVIEEVPKFCGRALPASSIFVMAQNHGVLIGAAIACGYVLVRVHPKEWQASLGTSKKSQGTEWKRFLKGRAQERFPSLDVTLMTADALLILDWARKGML